MTTSTKLLSTLLIASFSFGLCASAEEAASQAPVQKMTIAQLMAKKNMKQVSQNRFVYTAIDPTAKMISKTTVTPSTKPALQIPGAKKVGSSLIAQISRP